MKPSLITNYSINLSLVICEISSISSNTESVLFILSGAVSTPNFCRVSEMKEKKINRLAIRFNCRAKAQLFSFLLLLLKIIKLNDFKLKIN